MEPSGADRETGEGDERATFPVGRHVPTGGKNSRKSSINKTTMGGRSGHRRDITPGQARLVTALFVLRQLLFFFLTEVPHFSGLTRGFQLPTHSSYGLT